MEENIHRKSGYNAGKAEAQQHGKRWTGETLTEKAADTVNSYRWWFSEHTDIGVSGENWQAYRDGFIRGYQDPS